MSRAVIILRTESDRTRALNWCKQAPLGSRVEFKASRRSLSQNAAFWAALSDVAFQKEHYGRKYSTNIWRLLFLDAFGREMKFVPSLSGETVVPIGQSSSDLSKEEMSNLLEFVHHWGTTNGVVFHSPREAA